MSDERKWIVVWTSEVTLYKESERIAVFAFPPTKEIINNLPHDLREGYDDHWQVFEDFKEAEQFYENKWNEDDTYTASLTRILKSSDYNGELENSDE